MQLPYYLCWNALQACSAFEFANSPLSSPLHASLCLHARKLGGQMHSLRRSLGLHSLVNSDLPALQHMFQCSWCNQRCCMCQVHAFDAGPLPWDALSDTESDDQPSSAEKENHMPSNLRMEGESPQSTPTSPRGRPLSYLLLDRSSLGQSGLLQDCPVSDDMKTGH